jgi:hypothetical protein
VSGRRGGESGHEPDVEALLREIDRCSEQELLAELARSRGVEPPPAAGAPA